MQGSCSRGRNADATGAVADAEKAAAAVSGVSGEQILKAIVDAAGGGGRRQERRLRRLIILLRLLLGLRMMMLRRLVGR
ncbi:hypothetical protein CV643_05625 [Borreliella burgdorferi]|nr:variable large family protein [Borreliella burgdorferi]PRR21053.1 hypothetical protein CV643_05625 [Borreliella burgdorferi]